MTGTLHRPILLNVAIACHGGREEISHISASKSAEYLEAVLEPHTWFLMLLRIYLIMSIAGPVKPTTNERRLILPNFVSRFTRAVDTQHE